MRRSLYWLILATLFFSGCTRCTICDLEPPCIPICTPVMLKKKPPVYIEEYDYVIDYSCEGHDRLCNSCGQKSTHCNRCGGYSCGCTPCRCDTHYCSTCAMEIMKCPICKGSACGCKGCHCQNKVCSQCGHKGGCTLLGLCTECNAPRYSCSSCRSESCGCSQCKKGAGEADDIFGIKPFAPLMDEYIIAEGDILEISVFGDEDTLADNVLVAPDGKLYYLFFDGIQAAGLTIDKLQEHIEKRLADLYVEPSVSIIPQAMSSSNFTILGRVRAPGLYPMNTQVSLRQAIGIAGGVVVDPEVMTGFSSTIGGRYVVQSVNTRRSQGEDFSLRDSFIVRSGRRLPIDFEKLLTTASNAQDIPLKPGDYIYIATNTTREVFILGNVRAPSAVPYKQGMRLMGALASAGGWAIGDPYAADQRNVVVIRGALECPCFVRVDLTKIISGEARDLVLCPGDIVYVHNKRFRFARELVRLAIYAFLTSFFNEAGSFYAEELFNRGSIND